MVDITKQMLTGYGMGDILADTAFVTLGKRKLFRPGSALGVNSLESGARCLWYIRHIS